MIFGRIFGLETQCEEQATDMKYQATNLHNYLLNREVQKLLRATHPLSSTARATTIERHVISFRSLDLVFEIS